MPESQRSTMNSLNSFSEALLPATMQFLNSVVPAKGGLGRFRLRLRTSR